jgi:hypothetical protein
MAPGLARKPWRRAFMRVMALALSLRGPVDFFALRRFAAICFWVAITFSVRTKPIKTFLYLQLQNRRSQFCVGMKPTIF